MAGLDPATQVQVWRTRRGPLGPRVKPRDDEPRGWALGATPTHRKSGPPSPQGGGRRRNRELRHRRWRLSRHHPSPLRGGGTAVRRWVGEHLAQFRAWGTRRRRERSPDCGSERKSATLAGRREFGGRTVFGVRRRVLRRRRGGGKRGCARVRRCPALLRAVSASKRRRTLALSASVGHVAPRHGRDQRLEQVRA